MISLLVTLDLSDRITETMFVLTANQFVFRKCIHCEDTNYLLFSTFDLYSFSNVINTNYPRSFILMLEAEAAINNNILIVKQVPEYLIMYFKLFQCLLRSLVHDSIQ